MILSQQSDAFGAMASTLCLIHCIITPFIFIAQSCSMTCCSSAPSWWRGIDVLFLVIALLSVYWSAKTTTKKWIGTGLWICWAALAFIIINENVGWVSLSHSLIYGPSLGLVGLHLYNKKYCQCATGCCSVAEN